MLCEPASNASDNLCHLCRTTATVRTVRVYLTVFVIVTSTGRVLGRVIGCVTQYVTYHTLCKSQYKLTPISRAWSVPHTYPINKHLTIHCTCPAQAVCRYECVVTCNHLQCPYPKVSNVGQLQGGYAGATQGVCGICIWGVQRNGLVHQDLGYCQRLAQRMLMIRSSEDQIASVSAY